MASCRYSGLAGMGLAGLLRAFANDWQGPAWRLLQLAKCRDAAKRSVESSVEGSEAGGAPLSGHVSFKGVRFAYPTAASCAAASATSATSGESSSGSGPEVLGGVDLEVLPGRAVVVVGASGCGKSTLAKLVLGIYSPTAGAVTVDGKPVGAYDPTWFRQQV